MHHQSDSSAGDGHYKFYCYDPSTAAAIVFIILFSLQAIWHSFLLVKSCTWCWIPFLVGILFEVIGYVGRVLNSTQSPNWALGPYILQSLFILLGPALLAASVYMVLARIIRLTNGERFSLIRSKWITRVFVTGDVISFFMQAAGGSMQAAKKKPNLRDVGQYIVVAGLFVQILFFGFFVMLALVFHNRVDRQPSCKVEKQPRRPTWRMQLYVLYATSFLIMVRSIFRVVEYLQGRDGYLQTHEYTLYVFDAVLIFLVLSLFSVWFPGYVISNQQENESD